MKNKTSSLYWN